MTHYTDVDVTALRNAFLRSGLTASELCEWLEWRRSDGGPDTSRLRRALGLIPSSSHGQTKVAKRIGIDRAALIADAIGVDPHEVGI